MMQVKIYIRTPYFSQRDALALDIAQIEVFSGKTCGHFGTRLPSTGLSCSHDHNHVPALTAVTCAPLEGVMHRMGVCILRLLL